MVQCDVCFVECIDVGVLGCKHSVCRSCGMSQSKCLVCARIGRNQRRRLGKRVISRPANPVRLEDVQHRETSKESTPELAALASPPQNLPAPSTSPPTRSSPPKPRCTAPSPTSPDAHFDAVRTISPLPRPIKSVSPPGDDEVPEPPTKIPKKEEAIPEDSRGVKMVYGPTAFDEVRCELRALGTAPKLQRAAIRTTGKLSVGLLSQFVHTSLNLPSTESVILRCSGEDLTDGMTLGHLVTHVWPESEGHMILDYRIARHAVVRDPP